MGAGVRTCRSQNFICCSINLYKRKNFVFHFVFLSPFTIFARAKVNCAQSGLKLWH